MIKSTESAAKTTQVRPLDSSSASELGNETIMEGERKNKQDAENAGKDKNNKKKSVVSSLKKSLGMGKKEENKSNNANVPQKKKKASLFFCKSCMSDSTDPAATKPPPATTNTSPSTPGGTNPLPIKQVNPDDFSPIETIVNISPSILDLEAFGISKRALLCTSSASFRPSKEAPKTLPVIVDTKQEDTTPPKPPAIVTQVQEDPQDLSGFSLNLYKLLRRKGNAREFLLSKREKEIIIRDMNADFTDTLVQQMEQTEATLLEAHLFAARKLVWQFWALDDMIRKTRMPETTEEVVFGVMEAFLYPRLAVLYDLQEFDQLSPSDAALFVSWMDDFCRAVVEHATGVELQEEWQSDCDKLASFYMEKAVRQEMKACLGRTFAYRTDDDVREAGEGHLVTGLAEQVSYLVQQQLSVAKEALPRQYLPQVLSICNQETSLLVSDMQLNIGSEWRDISCSLYCAYINDANRLVEQCEERNEEYLNSETDEKLVEEANNLVKDLAELSLHATDYLCQRIMLYLCRPRSDILTSVGDLVWEQDETSNAVESTIETLKDFFGDLEEWIISDYYFAKVLKQCFQLVIRIYLESFFGNTLVRGAQNTETVARELRKDYVRLANFFNGEFFDNYRDEDNSSSFYPQAYINEELRVLQHMAAIVLPQNEPDFCHEDIIAIIKRFPGEEGSAAILHLAGLRKRNIHGAESVSWVKAIASAKKDMAKSEANDESKEEKIRVTKNKQSSVVHVPDLRNSKFIQNIHPVRLSVLDRDISEGTMDYAQSTMRLLDTTHRDPLVIKHAKGGAAAVKGGAAAMTRGIGAGLRFAIPFFPPAGDSVSAVVDEKKNGSVF